MLVEQTFVTTFERDDAMEVAATVLREIGFEVTFDGDALVASRGVRNVAKAKRWLDHPQQARVEFDRGRVVVAAGLEERRGKSPIPKDITMTVVWALEQSLVRHAPFDSIMEQWNRLVEHVRPHDRRRQRTRRVLLAIVLLVFTGSIALAVTAILTM